MLSDREVATPPPSPTKETLEEREQSEEEIEEIVEDRDLRNQMSIRSKKTAKLYSWKRYNDEIKKALDI